MTPLLGYLPDPRDPRDHVLDGPLGIALPTTPPAAHSARRLCLELFKQTNNDCVSNSGAHVVRASHVRQRLEAGETLEQIQASPPPLLSRRMGYWLPRAASGQQDVDLGTYIRSFYGCANAIGFAPESLWPYDRPVTARPSTAAFQAAFSQSARAKVRGVQPAVYTRLNGFQDAKVEQIKRAIASDRAVQFGLLVGEAFWKGEQDQRQPTPPPKDRLVGGHAMAALEYDAHGLRGPQTWGADWGGAGGWFYLSWEYVSEWAEDVWICDVAPLYSEEL